MKIAIGSDHAGFPLKEGVLKYLSTQDVETVDLGTHSAEPVDYPDFGIKVARMVASGEIERGILICGSGVGMSIVANRFPGVRAALCLDTEMAIMSRKHNDSNILVMAGRKTDMESAGSIVEAWLETEFEGDRHQRRLDKIHAMESGLKS